MEPDSPQPKALPDKLYFKVGEVSQITGVPAYVLRFWETEFKKIKPKRTPSGQRLYRKQDVELILTIKTLLYDQKYTIEGARRQLKMQDPTPPPKDPSGPVTLEEIRAELRRLRGLLS